MSSRVVALRQWCLPLPTSVRRVIKPLLVTMLVASAAVVMQAQTGITPVETGLQRLTSMCIRAVPYASTLGVLAAAIVIGSGHHEASTKATRIGIAIALALGANLMVSYLM